MDFMTIEQAIVDEIKNSVAGFATVERYTGQLDGDIEKLPGRLPAAFVVYAGSDYLDVDGNICFEQPRFRVFVATRDIRAKAAQPGAYTLMGDVLGALANFDLGLSIAALRPIKSELVHAGVNMSVYAVEFSTGFDTDYTG